MYEAVLIWAAAGYGELAQKGDIALTYVYSKNLLDGSLSSETAGYILSWGFP